MQLDVDPKSSDLIEKVTAKPAALTASRAARALPTAERRAAGRHTNRRFPPAPSLHSAPRHDETPGPLTGRGTAHRGRRAQQGAQHNAARPGLAPPSPACKPSHRLCCGCYRSLSLLPSRGGACSLTEEAATSSGFFLRSMAARAPRQPPAGRFRPRFAAMP